MDESGRDRARSAAIGCVVNGRKGGGWSMTEAIDGCLFAAVIAAAKASGVVEADAPRVVNRIVEELVEVVNRRIAAAVEAGRCKRRGECRNEEGGGE